MNRETLWQAFWLFLPFLAVVWIFRGRMSKRNRDLDFDPLRSAVFSGLVMSALFFALFSMPFLNTAIWDFRRLWWSFLGALPAAYWIAPAAGLLGYLFVRLQESRWGNLRWLTAAPLALWLICAAPQSQLVEMNRFARPRWQDGVCMQSTGFTCTPSAAATLLRVYGVEATESSMAVQCATTRSGTHVLGLARGLASKLPEGEFTVRACRITPEEIRHVYLPCITFTCCHAWVIYRIGGDNMLEIGEAMGGRRQVTWSDFASSFCGEAVLVTPNDHRKTVPLDGAGKEITQANTDPATLTLAGYTVYREVDESGRTLVRFGSGSIEKLQARTESEGW